MNTTSRNQCAPGTRRGFQVDRGKHLIRLHISRYNKIAGYYEA
jgi:hypothetical protein